MQFLKNRLTIALGCLVIIVVFVIAGFREPKIASGIYSGSSRRWAQLLNVHQSPTYWLVVDGKRYDGILGRSPYYLDIPEIGGVFFVTRDDRHRLGHFCFQSGRHIAFNLDDTYLGLGIGGSPGDPEYDVVLGVSDALVLIGSKQGKFMNKYEFDLSRSKRASLGRFPIEKQE